MATAGRSESLGRPRQLEHEGRAVALPVALRGEVAAMQERGKRLLGAGTARAVPGSSWRRGWMRPLDWLPRLRLDRRVTLLYFPPPMPEIDIALPDGSHKQVPAGTTVADFIQTQIGKGLARAALFARLDDEELDLSRPLTRSGKLRVITSRDKDGLDLIRHDAAHVVASVVQRLFP